MSDLQHFIETTRQKYDLPALSVAVYQAGEPDQLAATGVCKTGDATLATTADAFHMGSCTKAVTAAIIHKLAGEGKLSLNDRLGDLFPSAPMHEGYKAATVAQLLTHTAGFPANEGLLTDPPAHARGTHAYSNLGYTMLGYIAEKTSGKAFEQLARDEIFAPLGMATAGFGPTNAISGHTRSDTGTIADNSDNLPIFAAAINMHASPQDWLKFLKFELAQHRLEHPHSTAAYGNEHYTDSGLIRSGSMLSHDGSNKRNLARHVLLPDQKAAYIIATNEESPQAEQAVNDISNFIREHILKTPAVTAGRPASQSAGRE